MRVGVLASDPGRCGRRLTWPIEVLQRDGYDVGVLVLYQDSIRLLPEVMADVEVVVVQRPLHRWMLHMIRRAHEQGVTVVVELDDNLSKLDLDHYMRRTVDPRLHPDANYRILEECCRIADFMTVTTEALGRFYGRPGRWTVIPNHVPESYLAVEKVPHEGVRVGWPGLTMTHPHDLQTTGGGVAAAVTATGAEFVHIGASCTPHYADVGEALGIPGRVRECPLPGGSAGLAEYPVAVAQLDVGIVPLDRTPHNRAKSYLKGLEMAALGVPFVASPTGPYIELARHAGVLASSPVEWEREVRRLVVSSGWRAEMAGRGREWAASQTIEGNAGMWWEAWLAAREVAAKRRKVTA